MSDIKWYGDGIYSRMRQRRSGKVVSKVLEYLGRDPEPARLRRALRY